MKARTAGLSPVALFLGAWQSTIVGQSFRSFVRESVVLNGQ